MVSTWCFVWIEPDPGHTYACNNYVSKRCMLQIQIVESPLAWSTATLEPNIRKQTSK